MDDTLPGHGKFKAQVKTTNTQTTKATFYVTEGTNGSLLSWHTCQNLELIRFARALITPISVNKVDQLVQEYDNLFQGIRKVKGQQVKIPIKKTVQPVAQHHRKVPFQVTKQSEEQLEKDEQGVIGSTDAGQQGHTVRETSSTNNQRSYQGPELSNSIQQTQPQPRVQPT